MKKKRRREKGHIAPRGENKYLVRWRRDGKQVSKIVEGDYALALAFLAEQLNPKAPEPPKVPERTFISFVEKEWAQYVRDHWKDSTQTTLGSLVTRHITPFFQDKKLSEIKPTDIVEFHTKLENKHDAVKPDEEPLRGKRQKPLSRRTRHNIHAVLTCMFNWAVELQLIGRNPVPRRSNPTIEKPRSPRLRSSNCKGCSVLYPSSTGRSTRCWRSRVFVAARRSA